MNKALNQRLNLVENKLCNVNNITNITTSNLPTTTLNTTKPLKKGTKSKMSDWWYEWYTMEPLIWQSSHSRQTKCDIKKVVGYMKLFLPDGYLLDSSDPSYKEHVLKFGKIAEANIIQVFADNDLRAQAAGTALKQLRIMHRTGLLSDQIERYNSLTRSGKIVDSSPTCNISIVSN
jgi:hypothetical protein